MNQTVLILVLILSICQLSIAQEFIVKNDNGNPKGSYTASQLRRWEESVMLQPNGPCKILKIQVYFSGTQPNEDSLMIVADPAEGNIPPTEFVWHYALLTPPIKFTYDGVPGWKELDISDRNLRAEGLDRIVIQHIISDKGPYLTYDSDGTSSPLRSFLCDALTPNPDFYNIKGTKIFKADGDFLVRLVVEFDHPGENGSAKAPFPMLLDISSEAGLLNNTNTIQSALATAADWNQDGFDDIAIGSYFFENKKNGKFENVSSRFNFGGSGTVFGDYNNDGILDAFVVKGMGNDQLMMGLNNGGYSDETDVTIAPKYPTVTPMWLDYNTDGLLDLFVAYGRTEVSGQETYFPDQLYKNLGNGSFKNVTAESKISLGEPAPYYDCWGASICDYNNDGKPDIFVATYRLAPDRLYKNNGNGTFSEVSTVVGVHGVPTKSPGYFGHGMGSSWGDFNNDLYPDLAVGNLGHPDGRGESSNPSLIFRNDGPPTFKFSEVGRSIGLKFFEMNAGILWVDINLDGYLDLVHSQYSYENISSGRTRYSRVYINQGPENNFYLKDMTWFYGALIHGAWSPVALDFDNDGDMDILIASSNEYVKLFRNDLPRENNWVSFRLVGSPQNGVNMDAYGSSITLIMSDGKKIYRDLPGSIMTARASQSTNELNFGLGKNTIKEINVKFSDGKELTHKDIDHNRKYKIFWTGEIEPMVLAAPGLISPRNKEVLKNPKVDFKWSTCGGANNYNLEYSEYSNFEESTFINTPSDIETMILEPGKTYYWRVSSLNGNEESNFSTIWSFSIDLGAGTDNTDNHLKESSLYQNFPNPAFESTRFDFTLENEGFVRINLIDNSGKKISELLSDYLIQGNYSLNIETNNLPAGTYFYQLETKETKLTKKLIVLKR